MFKKRIFKTFAFLTDNIDDMTVCYTLCAQYKVICVPTANLGNQIFFYCMYEEVRIYI